MLVFASFGVQLFAGKLAKCNDPTIQRRVRLSLSSLFHVVFPSRDGWGGVLGVSFTELSEVWLVLPPDLPL